MTKFIKIYIKVEEIAPCMFLMKNNRLPKLFIHNRQTVKTLKKLNSIR